MRKEAWFGITIMALVVIGTAISSFTVEISKDVRLFIR